MTDVQLHPWTSDSFIAGILCLDFMNTVGGKEKERSPDHLRTYRDFLAWGTQSGLLDQEQATALTALSERHGTGDGALDAVRDHRERLYRIFSAIATQRSPDPIDLGGLNAALMACGGNLAVRPVGAAYEWAWHGLDQNLEGPLWPILRAAADLLTGPDLALVRECGRCSWLFLDRSRNRRRRWCKMEVCGNRSKAERHHRRQRDNRA